MDSRLTRLEARIDTILPTLATKADIAETKAAISAAESSGVRVAFVGLSIAVGVVLFALNRISPPQQPVSQPAAQPVIVYPPSAPQAAHP
jgi:hypothetical protein